MSVQPESQTAFCTLKGDKESSALHGFRNFKIFHIACHRIKLFRDLSGSDLLMAFPGILGVGILRHIITLHLDVCRHPDILPASAVIVRRFKSRYGRSIIAGIVEFPKSVQALGKPGFLFFRFLDRGVIPVIRMGVQSSVPEISGVFHFLIVKYVHVFFPPFICLQYTIIFSFLVSYVEPNNIRFQNNFFQNPSPLYKSQMDMQAYPLGSLLAGINLYSKGICFHNI